MSNLSIDINLLKLDKAAVMEIKNRNGENVKCVVLPIDDNDLYASVNQTTGQPSVYLSLAAWENREKSKYGDTHYIKQSHSKSWREAHPDTKTPIIGNAKVIQPVGLDQVKANQAEVITQGGGDPFNDLPF